MTEKCLDCNKFISYPKILPIDANIDPDLIVSTVAFNSAPPKGKRVCSAGGVSLASENCIRPSERVSQQFTD